MWSAKEFLKQEFQEIIIMRANLNTV
jgi:hypothetical protein